MRLLALAIAVALLGPPSARAGDIRGTVHRGPRARAAALPVIVFVRGNGMVTTRRGGPRVENLTVAPEGFEPRCLVIRHGDTLRVVNRRSSPEHLFLATGETTLDLGTVPPNRAVAHVLHSFATVEVYTGRPGEASAWVLAAENPFHTETDAQGVYVLEGVTPGDYDVCAWQGGAACAATPVTVPLMGTVTAAPLSLR